MKPAIQNSILEASNILTLFKLMMPDYARAGLQQFFISRGGNSQSTPRVTACAQIKTDGAVFAADKIMCFRDTEK